MSSAATVDIDTVRQAHEQRNADLLTSLSGRHAKFVPACLDEEDALVVF